jgi:AbrB family looped-hinge helix DNA binding protein
MHDAVNPLTASESLCFLSDNRGNTILNGNITTIMATTVEIDKAGRIVVPKKFREALHIRAGDRFIVEERDDGIFLQPAYDEVRLVEKDGVLVMVGGAPATYDIVELMNEDRERRMRYVSGESDEP